MNLRFGLALVAIGFSMCVPMVKAQGTGVPASVKAAEKSIDAEKIRAHVKFLADDLLEGRGPGLRGGDLAAKYIATQFALDGLKPGGDDGTYFQQVDFFGMTVKRDATTFSLAPASGGAMALKFGPDYVVNNPRHTPVVNIDAPVVFVGYGVTAPEYGWDDYAGVDVKGKVVLIIVGDPPSDDPKFFAGKALTYYGRWTYKYEQAARKGAIGALLIHRTDLAAYGWSVVQNSGSGEKTFLASDTNPQVAAAAWIHHDVADKLFAAAKLGSTDAEIDLAGKRGFKAVELPVRLKAHIESTVRSYKSPNVVGILVGDPSKYGASEADRHIAGDSFKGLAVKEQAVMYSAHYDHLGFVPGMAGDNIYNGAADNATGCGILLELARSWAALGQAPPHSIIFASVTAEEQGLLGSEYLGQHPPIEAAQITLDLNYDDIQPFGDPLETKVDGADRTSFYPTVQATAREFGLGIVPDAHPEAGHYYRSDHFSMARAGVPAFSIGQGTLYAGHDAAWGLAKEDDYTAHRYHNFSDNYTEDMDFSGNAKLARFGFELGWKALMAPATVDWRAGDEFEAARKKSQGQ
ncbi:MAG: M28 family peptidase [Acidobacteriota bacterium]|nr:M28 family peptidase [Acidobacteriota bacterium]